MNIANINPTTAIGIKRLAREISRKQNIKHSDALKDAAQAAGYPNFIAARRALNKPQPINTVSTGLYITAYWSELNAGRETIYLDYLPNWPQLLSRQQLLNCRALMSFRGQAPDHLVLKEVSDSRQVAIRKICHAARELQFMHATGLKPVQRAHVSFRSFRQNRPELPETEHASAWRTDAGTKVFLDEPYHLTPDQRALRDQWSQQQQFAVCSAAWSVYQPDLMNEMYLVSDNRQVAGQMANRLSKYTHRPVAESSWNQPSHSYRPLFQSPLQPVCGAQLRAPSSNALRIATRLTIPMNGIFMGHNDRRPNARMPLDVHEDVASRLNAIQTLAYYRSGVFTRITRVKHALDEWVQREFTRAELPHERFTAMYLSGGHFSDSAKHQISPNECMRAIASLEHIGQTLSKHYPVCAPLNKQLIQLDLAVQSLKKWSPKA